jgi:hypothetical protein
VSASRNSWQASVYADTRLTAQEIASYLAHALGGTVSGSRADLVVAERIEVDVTQNDRSQRSEPVDPEDAFLYFPYDIEIFTGEAFDEAGLVADIAAVLAALDRLRVRYVIAADFENEFAGRRPERTLTASASTRRAPRVVGRIAWQRGAELVLAGTRRVANTARAE